jgi:hypothetical protein
MIYFLIYIFNNTFIVGCSIYSLACGGCKIIYNHFSRDILYSTMYAGMMPSQETI